MCIYVYVNVNVYVYIYVCVDVYVYICVYIYTLCIYIYMYTYMYKHYTCVSMNVCIYTNIYRNASPECDGDERPFLKVRLFQCMNLGSSPAYLPFAFCWMIIKWPTKFKFEVEDSFTNILM